MTSIIYRWPTLYKLALRLSYRGNYGERYRVVSDLLPDGIRLVDYCCGDAEIYERCLRSRDLEYLGIDFNPRFIEGLRRRGVPHLQLDIREEEPVEADYSLMMASLYQFYPNHGTVLDSILARTGRLVIAEPVKNHGTSKNRAIRKLANLLNDPGDGVKTFRFDADSFGELVSQYRERVVSVLEGEIETVVVLEGDR